MAAQHARRIQRLPARRGAEMGAGSEGLRGEGRMKPPFRADQVGSLLRPVELAQARVRWKKDELPKEKLVEMENRAIREAVKAQEAIGLEAITDGEFRRDWWHLDLLAQS